MARRTVPTLRHCAEVLLTLDFKCKYKQYKYIREKLACSSQLSCECWCTLTAGTHYGNIYLYIYRYIIIPIVI